jgi:predicted transcriptional regulator
MRTEHRNRSPLGLGPLESAIMQVLWEAGGWLRIRDIRDRMDYSPVAYTTVATVTGVLCEKDLLARRQATPGGTQGKAGWLYCAARPAAEHIGELVAELLDRSPNPGATLACALATARTAAQIGNSFFIMPCRNTAGLAETSQDGPAASVSVRQPARSVEL